MAHFGRSLFFLQKIMIEKVIAVREKMFSFFIPINKSKIPIVKEWQKKRLTNKEIQGYHSELFGLLCGDASQGIEVIDVDLKILPTKEEKDKYEKDILSILSDHIDDFYKKVAIYRTMSNGLHILYKCDNYEGNKKLAKIQQSKEALIETRGEGGFVVFYPDFHHKGLKYEGIKKITNEDRNIIIECCRSFNHNEVVEVTPFEAKESVSDVTPWDEYNKTTSCFDLVSDEFTVVRDLTDYLLIKRNGAKSISSGKIFKDSNCLYLHSTGTQYESEKLISPFVIYAIKNHNGDISEAASELYKKGFGTRYKKTNYTFKEVEIKQEDNDFPLGIFPKQLQEFIKENNEKLGLVTDFMACSLLWVASSIVGNTAKVEIKRGWTDIVSVWIACVAKAGVGKTPSISAITAPLEKINQKEQKLFAKDYKKFQDYKFLSNDDKKYQAEVEEPVNKQFIANDITLEALVQMLSANPNGIGVLKDELNGWVQDMNKYRDGSDLSFWLSSFSGSAYSSNRKTSGNAFVDNPFVPVIGGIQPDILTSIYTSENKSSGFTDRLLLSYPNVVVNDFIDDEMDEDLIEWYTGFVRGMIIQVKDITQFDDDGQVIPIISKFSSDAKSEYKRIFNQITERQNNDKEDESMKSILPKLKIYLGRFSFLIHFLKWSLNKEDDLSLISIDSVQKAEDLINYFQKTAINNKKSSVDVSQVNEVIKQSRAITWKHKVDSIIESEIETTHKQIADTVGVSRRTVLRYLKSKEK